MARTSDPHSATAQFFINVNNNDFLNYPGQDGQGYAVFGKVVDGLDVVMKIAKTQIGPARRRAHAARAVIIESMTVVGQEGCPALFVSDLHLTEERPEANERFISFVEGQGLGTPRRFTFSATCSSTGSATTTSAIRSTP